jgi:hypothetical protein
MVTANGQAAAGKTLGKATTKKKVAGRPRVPARQAS